MGKGSLSGRSRRAERPQSLTVTGERGCCVRLVANERGGRAVLGEVMRGMRAQEDRLKDRVVCPGGEHVAFALVS